MYTKKQEMSEAEEPQVERYHRIVRLRVERICLTSFHSETNDLIYA